MGTDCLPIVKVLLQYGVSVTEQCGDRAEAPIHLASVIGCPETTRLLVDAGADIDIQTIYSETPLWLCAWKDNEDVARLLIQLNCQLDVASNGYQVYRQEYLPLEVALGRGSYGMTGVLLEAGCSTINERYFSREEAGPVSALPGMRLRKEVFDLVQMNTSAFQWLVGVCQNPRSLKSHCRLIVRRRLGKNLPDFIHKLPLPPLLKFYVMMHDL